MSAANNHGNHILAILFMSDLLFPSLVGSFMIQKTSYFFSMPVSVLKTSFAKLNQGKKRLCGKVRRSLGNRVMMFAILD